MKKSVKYGLYIRYSVVILFVNQKYPIFIFQIIYKNSLQNDTKWKRHKKSRRRTRLTAQYAGIHKRSLQ